MVEVPFCRGLFIVLGKDGIELLSKKQGRKGGRRKNELIRLHLYSVRFEGVSTH